MKKNLPHIVLIFVCSFVCFSLPAWAEEWIVGSMENFAPFNFERKGIYDGIDTRILDEAAQSIGVKLVHKPRPWKRAIKMLERKKSDALFQLSGKGDWFEKYYPVGPIRPNKRMLFVQKSSSIDKYEGYENLNDIRIGVIKDFQYGKEFAKAVAEGKVMPVYYSKPSAALRALHRGRIDAVIETYEIFRFEASKQKLLDDFKAVEPPISENSRYIVFHRDPSGLEKADRLQKALDQMRAKGRIKEIIDGFR